MGRNWGTPRMLSILSSVSFLAVSERAVYGTHGRSQTRLINKIEGGREGAGRCAAAPGERDSWIGATGGQSSDGSPGVEPLTGWGPVILPGIRGRRQSGATGRGDPEHDGRRCARGAHGERGI